MRFTRSLLCLGFVLALTAQSAWGQDGPVYSPFPSISSPYCPRDQGGQPIGVPAPGTTLAPGATTPGSTPAANSTVPSSTTPGANGTAQPSVFDGNTQGADMSGGGLASAGEMSGGASSGGGGMPGMIGDFIGPYALQQVPFKAVFPDGTVFRGTNIEALPILSRGPYKIAENESPQPQDRVFVTFNYYRIEGAFPDPSPTINSIDLYRQVVGFEKTFLNGHASIGARVPFFQSYYAGRTYAVDTIDGPAFVSYDNSFINFDESELGDVTLILKFAMGCCKTGKLCSFGVAATIPTGPDLRAYDIATGLEKDIHSGLLQPYVGTLYTCGGWYVHYFSSIVFPLHTGDDPIIWFNDLGVGYFLYGNPECAVAQQCGAPMIENNYGGACITSIVPTLEVHYNSALTNGGRFDYVQADSGSLPFVVTDEIVRMSNSFVLTGGVHVGLFGKSTLTVGAAVPLTVQPFDVEAIAQLNVRF
jgi:hypothetical protein